MARPLRIEFEDAIYHLCARGNARQAIFHGERDRARFVELLSESTKRFEAAILCFVLMGNHFHLAGKEIGVRSKHLTLVGSVAMRERWRGRFG